MYPTPSEYLEFVVVVQWNRSVLIHYLLRAGWGGELHVPSLGIERIYSSPKRCVLLVQHDVRTLDKLRYDVRLPSGMKRFEMSVK